MFVYPYLKVLRCAPYTLPFFLLVWGNSLFAQSYDKLYEKIQSLKGHPIQQESYMLLFLEKAKRENNAEEIVNGYRNFMHNSEGKIARLYADSMVNSARQTNDSLLTGSAYLSKGIFYYGLKMYDEALQNYLIANQYVSNNVDDYLQYKVQYNIAQIKYYLGEYPEAILLLQGCLAYFRENHPRAYLNTLHSLALNYNRKGDIGLSSETIQRGLEESKRLSIDKMEAYFKQTAGINEYFRENFGTATELLIESLPTIIENKDFANEAVGHFYLGKSYWALKKTDKALKHFIRVDEIFNTYQYIRNDLRETYILMADYHKRREDFESQIYQLNQLLRADSVLRVHYKNLSQKIHQEYDTPEILRERDFAQRQLEKKSGVLHIALEIIGILCLLIAAITYRHFKNQKLYKKRFEALMKKDSSPKKRELFPIDGNTGIEMNAEAEKSILVKLEKFEKNQKFLEKDWTLFKLAAHFNSNNKYLSQVIHQYRNMNFPNYINHLKIQFIIEQLKSNRKMRKYTQKALAEEAGFSTTQRFTNAFKSYTGISVGFFIEELEK